MTTIPLTCDALVDQGRIIGGDPVGHACCMPGTAFIDGYFLCQSCEGIYYESPERLTLDPGRRNMSIDERKAEVLRIFRASMVLR